MSNYKHQQSSSHLSLEERDILQDVDSNTLRTILRDLEHSIQQMELSVISYQYKPGKETELAHLKSKAQGARELLTLYAKKFNIQKL